MEQTLTTKPRIEVVDALRGFAVMAIVLVHSVEHFNFSIYPENPSHWMDVLNTGTFNGIFALFAGKAYAIFSMLFGLTFYIQMQSGRKKGIDFGWRFLWRMLLLLVFANINAAFFPAGDVLLLFVIMSIVLFITRHWSDKAILILAIVFLLQPYQWYHFFAAIIDPAHALPDFRVGPLYGEVISATASGDFWRYVWTNLTAGQVASLAWALDNGRFFQIGGMFLLGFYFGRKQLFFNNERNNRIWLKILVVSAVAFSPLITLKELIMDGEWMVGRQTAGAAFDMWQKLAFTLVLVSSFVLLYNTTKFSSIVGDLRFYGRMSLTNYLSQSVIGALIYYPIGLGLAYHCGCFVSVFIGILTIAAQMWFCKWWLSRHRQGPLESLWHKWTWMGAKK